MPVWAVTGKLGAGKTLVAVSRIQKYLNENRRIATNLDLNLEHLINDESKNATVFRMPDVPTIDSFKAIGQGYDGKFQGDHKNGLVVLDECAKWLNTRNWSDKNRKSLIDYFVHLRKLRWDMILIIQDIDALDKQFRDLYCEHVVYCTRSDRYNIPFVGWIFKLLNGGDRVTLPRMHVGEVFYSVGNGRQNKVENWFYRGTKLMKAYDTEQAFYDDSPHEIYQYLPPYLTVGRYKDKYAEFKKTLKSIRFYHVFFIGLFSGSALVSALGNSEEKPERGAFTCNDSWEKLFGSCDITHADVKIMLARHNKKESSTGVSRSLDLDTQGEDLDPLDGVYISGSVGVGGSQFEYVFSKNGETFYPFEHGYRTYDIDDCSATLLNMSDRTDRTIIYCKK